MYQLQNICWNQKQINQHDKDCIITIDISQMDQIYAGANGSHFWHFPMCRIFTAVALN